MTKGNLDVWTIGANAFIPQKIILQNWIVLRMFMVDFDFSYSSYTDLIHIFEIFL